MRTMMPHASAVLLAIIALALAGCDKPAVLPANAGIVTGSVPASAVHPRLMVATTTEHSRQKVGKTRGALLYSTHCVACHTAKVYWREKKLVTEINSLRLQVRRWQSSIGLNWTEDEIAEVVRYLNAVHYGFPDVDQKGFWEEENNLLALRKN